MEGGKLGIDPALPRGECPAVVDFKHTLLLLPPIAAGGAFALAQETLNLGF